MALDPTDFSLMERNGVMFILLVIDESPGLSKMDLTRICGQSTKTTLDRVNDLIDEGLVSYERNGGRNNLILTERGMEIADRLKDIRLILLSGTEEQEEE